jgi:hypothetical protein
VDADGLNELTFACATTAEERVAKRLGLRTVRVGVRVANGVPEGRLVSFGLAGALDEELAVGTVLDATRVVAEDGSVLWEGGPLGVEGARQGTILAAERIVDDPEERRRLHGRTGADAADLESGPLARSGRLAGCVRAVSDTPARTLGPLARTIRPDGRLSWGGVAGALARPVPSLRAYAGLRRALRSLVEAVA